MKVFRFGYNGLGNEGALAVGDCLRNNNILTELDITCNRITLDGAIAIAKGLDTNENLRILKVSTYQNSKSRQAMDM